MPEKQKDEFFFIIRSGGSDENMSDFDTAVIERFVGGCGRWQLRQFAVVAALGVAAMAPVLLHVFTSFAPEHRCKIPVCDDNDVDFYAQHLSFTTPINNDSDKAAFLGNFKKKFDGVSMMIPARDWRFSNTCKCSNIEHTRVFEVTVRRTSNT